MSHILIDGYNLIGIHHRDLESQRQRLVERLAEYRKIKGHEITVVFDGWKSGSGDESHSVIGGIKVIYSRLGEKADAVIKRIISSEKKQWIVITSDREIADHAWANGSAVVSSGEFSDILEKPLRVETGEFDLIDEDEYEVPKKGSPRRLSKKEKAKIRALSKL
ncbi:MAG: NYN domain-containing protein [Nitrospirae bacterium]|nr:NYN domain-containing protein [Nitrospirota bacterium]MBI3376835.1 NYN domain-containing protein [Nitrospirota bacterium]